ncbi:MAG: Gfo/Idh/MocA family oxidoreductase [Bryobacteraceae bacterium]|nr:Gfo/Idh/MocA family oxidoreductase [Bryobacteraceae bacterium]
MRRRNFVKASGLGVTALSASRVVGANDRIHIGLIGCGGRGRGVARSMREAPDVAYTAVADVYSVNAELAREWAGPDAKAFRDFRELLERTDVDAVHIATPDHWHAIASVLACEAGKDVFVEKPTSLTVREGRAMVSAARKYNRIVQVGTQHRSAPHFMKIAEIVQRGDIGEVKFVRIWNYANHTLNPLRPEAGREPPPELDWDMYLGPSPKVPFDPHRFLGTYRYFWDYSGGYITDFGNHRLDTMQQIMNVTAPRAISASGGLLVLKDGRETPDFLTVTYEYDGFIATYEGSNLNNHGMGGRTPGHRYYNARGEWDQPNGMAFYGTEATIYAERIGWEIFPEPDTAFIAGRRRTGEDAPPPPPRRQRAPSVKRIWENVEEPTKAHCLNFIECLRSRKTPNADIEIGHRGTSIALLGNIAMKTGKKLRWDAQKEDFSAAPDASAMLTRKLRKPYDWIKL